MVVSRSVDEWAEIPDESNSTQVVIGASSPAHELAKRGWSSILAALVTSLMTVLTLTGLWIYLSPFSRVAQVQVLIHVMAGLLVLLPYAYYQIHHFWVWRKQKSSVVMVVGYLLMGMMLACILSGLIATWQALMGPKTSPFWKQVHIVSGIGTGILTAVHLLAAAQRRWQMFAKHLELKRAVCLFFSRVGGMAIVAGLLVVGFTNLIPIENYLRSIPENYSLPEYATVVDEYQGSPFAPSYARTSTGTLIDSKLLSNSASCGTSGCHEQIYHEWLPSAHRFSAMNPPFQQIQINFAADRQPAETRYCAGCHDPISLFAGAKDIHSQDLSAPGMQEGCSCVVCHSISSVDERGNGDYILTPPQKYLWEDSDGWRKQVSDFLIRAYPRQHLSDYDRPVLRSPEFCGACHKQFIPEALNKTGLTPGQNQYDEWKESHWNTGDSESTLSCIDCHMRLVDFSTDPARGEGGAVRRSPTDGKHRHHGTIATNLFIPELMKLENWEEHCRLTREWIRGETVIKEIEHLWPSGPVVELKLVAPQEARSGEPLKVHAIIVNRKAGHNFTTGPLDFMRAWIHLTAIDATGNVLGEWGAIDPQTRYILDEKGQPQQLGGKPSEGTLILAAEPLDQEDNPILKHELWNKAGGRGQRTVFPTYSDSQSYTIAIPETAVGPIRIVADLNFRRYRQQFLDLTLPGMESKYGFFQPNITKTSDEVIVELIPQ